jgi:hypothetical protein
LSGAASRQDAPLPDRLTFTQMGGCGRPSFWITKAFLTLATIGLVLQSFPVRAQFQKVLEKNLERCWSGYSKNLGNVQKTPVKKLEKVHPIDLFLNNLYKITIYCLLFEKQKYS